MPAEIDIANEAIALLRRHGDASLVYLTAEFAPYSSQNKPDISFVPQSGKQAGEIFVIELKLLSGRQLLPHQAMSILEHRSFVAESVEEGTCHFAFATDESLTPDTVHLLHGGNVYVIVDIQNAQDLAHRIMQWVS